MEVDGAKFTVIDDRCPACGGSVVIEDGYKICVAPGTCCWSEEVE